MSIQNIPLYLVLDVSRGILTLLLYLKNAELHTVT